MRVSVNDYLQDSFQLPNDSKKSSKNACNEEEKEA